MSELPTTWCQMLGTHDATWPRALRAFEPYVYRAQRELTSVGEGRTVLIEGPVSNRPSLRDGSTALATRTAFDHGGHLIAARFGGPTCVENLVQMHGGINMRGGRWSNMEDQIGRLLGDDKGMLRVQVRYADDIELRPERFSVELVTLAGRHLWVIDNYSPFMSDPRSPEHWRARILEELKRRQWSISTARRQKLLACRSAATLEGLYGGLRSAGSAGPAFQNAGL
jgi:hypothetical protein